MKVMNLHAPCSDATMRAEVCNDLRDAYRAIGPDATAEAVASAVMAKYAKACAACKSTDMDDSADVYVMHEMLIGMAQDICSRSSETRAA